VIEMPKLVDIGSIIADTRHMADIVQQSLKDSARSLSDRDVDLARSVVERDPEIDRLKLAIEQKCLDALAEKLEGRNLRVVAATYRFVTDLERIGDYSVAVARVTMAVANKPVSGMALEIMRMEEIAERMLQRCMEVYAGSSKASLESTFGDDLEIDRLYEKVFFSGLGEIVHEPESATNVVYQIVAARALERIGDHITDIAERVQYIETGRLAERSQPMYVPPDVRDARWE